MVKVTNWCALATALGERAAAPPTQPTFQPVSEKILPAEPILTVRSAMPGKAASGTWRAAVEHDMLPDLVGERDRVVRDAGLGEQRQLVRVEHARGRIVRVVEDDQAGAFGERRGERLAR